MKHIKYIKRQDSGLKLSAGNSGETSLNLSSDIFDFLSKGEIKKGEKKDVTFTIFKEDCIDAMCFAVCKLPLYKTSSKNYTRIDDKIELFNDLYKEIQLMFGVNKTVDYTVTLYYREDGRFYINGLRVNDFSIRDFLVENNSAIRFQEDADGLSMRILSDIGESEQNEQNESSEEYDECSKLFSLQQIYYGAPGTGKSHEIKEQTAEAEEQGRVFRTTFHPDSDYSTFVGCYKPTISQKAVRNVAGDVVKRDGEEVLEDFISYKFVPQAFTNAYVKAWQTNEPVFLIIEEINRGNCAQIFGDLFQLLDRGDDGVSDYPIKADTDLCQYLEKELGEDGSKGIKDGKLCLPANLHIWATMNTSDQSLFPIDSAFKRRWDWHYTPICNANKGWKVEANGNQYDWWDFLQKINGRIERATSSEDKQLGYFFCKADGNGVISAEKFVSKVIFYLWNDVFKDFADSSDDPFKVADGNRMTFRSFYIADENGKTIVNEDNVEALLGSLGVDFFSKTTSEEEIEEEDEFGDNSNKPKYSINGVGEIPQNRLAEECLREYIKLNPEQSVEEVLAKWRGLGNIVSHFVESKDEFDARTDSKKDRSTAVHCKDSVIYIANDGYSAKNGKTEMLLNAVNSKNWGIKVAKVVKVA